MPKALVIAGVILALGCGASAPDEMEEGASGLFSSEGELTVEARFVAFRLSRGSTFCSASGEACGGGFEIDAQGRVTEGSGEGVLADVDLERFAALATGATFVAALRAGTDCHATADGSTRISVAIADGLEVAGAADCSGVIGEVAEVARSLAAGALGESGEVVWPQAPAEAARISEPLTFDGFSLLRAPTACPDGPTCAVGTSISREGFIVRGPRHGQVPAQELAAFTDVALSEATLEALLVPEACAVSQRATERLALGIAEGLGVGGDIAGCEVGPIADLRAVADALVEEFTEE